MSKSILSTRMKNKIDELFSEDNTLTTPKAVDKLDRNFNQKQKKAIGMRIWYLKQKSKPASDQVRSVNKNRIKSSGSLIMARQMFYSIKGKSKQQINAVRALIEPLSEIPKLDIVETVFPERGFEFRIKV